MREKNGFFNEIFVINMLNMKINFYFWLWYDENFVSLPREITMKEKT